MYLWLDDTRIPTTSDWTWVRTVSDAIEALESGKVDVASLDNDLGMKFSVVDGVYAESYDEEEPEGFEVVRFMVAEDIWPTRMLSIHSSNIVRSQDMRLWIEEYGPYDTKSCGQVCGYSARIYSMLEDSCL